MLTLLLAATARAANRRLISLEFRQHDYSAAGHYETAAGDVALAVTQTSSGSAFGLIVSRPPATRPYVLPAYELDNPPVSGPKFALIGRVSYADLDKPACLELVGHFKGGVTAATQTLAESGLEMVLLGTSAARSFRLPFDSPHGVPIRLTLNVVVPGRGVVKIEEAEIVEIERPASAPAFAPVAAAPVGPDAASLDGLPPAVIAEMQKPMAIELAAMMSERARVAEGVTKTTQALGAAHPEVLQARGTLATIDTRIAGLKRALAASLAPALASVAPPAIAVLPLTWGFVKWLAGHVGIGLGAAWVWLHVRRGFGRGIAFVFFGGVLVAGLAEIFLAGVATGLNRPPQGTALVLGGAIFLTGMALFLLPRINRHFADAELRKMRAMDVA